MVVILAGIIFASPMPVNHARRQAVDHVLSMTELRAAVRELADCDVNPDYPFFEDALAKVRSGNGDAVVAILDYVYSMDRDVRKIDDRFLKIEKLSLGFWRVLDGKPQITALLATSSSENVRFLALRTAVCFDPPDLNLIRAFARDKSQYVSAYATDFLEGHRPKIPPR